MTTSNQGRSLREIEAMYSHLYSARNAILEQLEEARQTAVYAESLGSADLLREADHEVFVYEERLAYTLMLCDTIAWMQGRKVKHVQEAKEILDEHRKQMY